MITLSEGDPTLIYYDEKAVTNYMVISLAVTLVTVVNVHAAVPNVKCKAQAGVLQFPLA